jgi:hypothetical protein
MKEVLDIDVFLFKSFIINSTNTKIEDRTDIIDNKPP